MNLTATLARLGKDSITVLRAGADTFVGGVRTPAARTATALLGSVQPASPSDIQRLPEGFRSRETRTVFVPFQLRSADDRTGIVADQIQLADGSLFEVANVDPWFNVAGYCKATCTRAEG